ncbi:hypothetical protein J2S43_007825 [Catenuloplanes nepalensis]|uniref:Uncharacterized protein n=1 Tax=Catenuloplanes nepalensis TaxID=587533 RepID=A0ABT9N6H8_9ACTN|nr:hypothetical protein [Catenuloplanes nepalensis]MDP9799313.1 hypothetical protein [Catenuloplanes nepalensis]
MSIDDLFAGAEERQTRKSRWRWVTGALLAGLGTGVVYVLLRAEELTASVPVLFMSFLALVVLRRVVASVGVPGRAERPPRHVTGGEEPGTYNFTGGDGLRRAVARWERVLNWNTEDTARFHRLTVPALRELADERLRQRHGVTIASDQRRARELLGDQLWTLLTAPPKRAPKPRQFASLVTRLEEL